MFREESGHQGNLSEKVKGESGLAREMWWGAFLVEPAGTEGE